MEVEEAIYNSQPLRTHSIIMIKGIMDSLDETDKKHLKKQYDQLQKLRHNSSSEEAIEELYTDITSYLHKNYLQEVHLGIIPAASIPTEAKPTSHEAVPSRLSAKLP
jgi:hypothetical protein